MTTDEKNIEAAQPPIGSGPRPEGGKASSSGRQGGDCDTGHLHRARMPPLAIIARLTEEETERKSKALSDSASALLKRLTLQVDLSFEEYNTSTRLPDCRPLSGSLISGAFSGLIAAGVTANMHGARGLSAWQWLFLIEGVITVGVAFACFFILPNFPRTTKWLSEEERELAAWRPQVDIGEDDWIDSEGQTFWKGAKMAFMDIKTYVLMVLVFSIVASSSVTNFFPTVVETLKFDRVKSLLLTSPPYILSVVTTFLVSWNADRTGERFWHISIPLVVGVASFVIAATTTTLAPRYVSMILMIPSVYPPFVISLAWISNTLPRPPAKRAAALAFINAISNSSSIWTGYMYPNSAAPQYRVAMSVCGMMAAIAIIAAGALKFMLARLNKQLEKGVWVVEEGAINALPDEGAQHGFRFKV
ncbi:major facilitator superfamily domain-containing protein [Zalerion maritima]|uniref:Major facilitator superfamily domain-containing protein n=1 Tax=Zalerion maritima TaxID=339359 RepID=A0AAD5RIV0_9PEZI|nr:major facilitator superfamily domain-containing protein [Zalerion maritima]